MEGWWHHHRDAKTACLEAILEWADRDVDHGGISKEDPYAHCGDNPSAPCVVVDNPIPIGQVYADISSFQPAYYGVDRCFAHSFVCALIRCNFAVPVWGAVRLTADTMGFPCRVMQKANFFYTQTQASSAFALKPNSSDGFLKTQVTNYSQRKTK